MLERWRRNSPETCRYDVNINIADVTGRVIWRNSPLTEPFGMSPPEEDPDGDGVSFSLNLRFPGQYYDKETKTHYNYYRDYDPLHGRYLQSDPIGLGGGVNNYGYVNGNPLATTDYFGLRTGITIWQPIGWGESSFGHVSTDVDGTTYSFGPGGMTVMSTTDYRAKNNFRSGAEVTLDLAPEQEALLKSCLSQTQEKYSSTGNNCGRPVQNCLKDLGVDTGNQLLPVSLGNKLLEMGIRSGTTLYPATRPVNGLSAPWAK